MHRWRVLILAMGVTLLPFSAHAQNPVSWASLQVELRPEYDQPSMLVIYDFQPASGMKLPVGVSIRFPKDSTLFAVAFQGTDGALLNADYLGPSVNDNWQSITVQIQTATTYHMEYYEPLSVSGQQRQFSYLWPGDYVVQDFRISVRVPTDTTNITSDPPLQPTQAADGAALLAKDFGALGAGQQFPLQLTYTKTSTTLSVTQQKLQPSQPLGANTPGRVMLSNYLPYILGALGALLIIAGSVYLWQSRRSPRQAGQRRRHPVDMTGREAPSDVYCHQCGTRAQTGDRFCRVCGTKLRLPE